jgi:hypothetical protein
MITTVLRTWGLVLKLVSESSRSVAGSGPETCDAKKAKHNRVAPRVDKADLCPGFGWHLDLRSKQRI